MKAFKFHWTHLNKGLAFGACTIVAGIALWPRPQRLEIAPQTVDLGIIHELNPVPASFTLKNAGSSDLLIGKVSASCDCTHIESFPSVLAGGKNGEVVFFVNPRNLRGPIEREIGIFTNDPQEPLRVVKLRFKIAPFLEMTPSTLEFGTLRRGQLPISKTFRVDALDKDAGIEIGYNGNAQIQKIPGDPGKLDVKVTISEKAATGTYADPIVISQGERKISGTLYYEIENLVSVTPNTAYLGTLKKSVHSEHNFRTNGLTPSHRAKAAGNLQEIVKNLSLDSTKQQLSFEVIPTQTELISGEIQFLKEDGVVDGTLKVIFNVVE